jgi:hypothetical protein
MTRACFINTLFVDNSREPRAEVLIFAGLLFSATNVSAPQSLFMKHALELAGGNHKSVRDEHCQPWKSVPKSLQRQRPSGADEVDGKSHLAENAA